MAAPLDFPPTQLDVALSKRIADSVSPSAERVTRALTWAADEHLTLGIATAFWVYCRISKRERAARNCANHVLLSAAVSATLPHLIKRIVDRTRRDRTLVHGDRHGIPRSGKAEDSFPSGHAAQVAAVAAAISRVYPGLKCAAWPLGIGLASTRLVLLAHYLTDVVAGLGMGWLVERTVAGISRQWR